MCTTQTTADYRTSARHLADELAILLRCIPTQTQGDREAVQDALCYVRLLRACLADIDGTDDPGDVTLPAVDAEGGAA